MPLPRKQRFPGMVIPLTLFLLALLALAACRGGNAPQIAFESHRDGNAEIYLMNADGSNLRNLTLDPAYDGTPAWSPDGTQLAFTSERDGMPNVYIMDLEGESLVQLTSGENISNGVPVWSPDGQRIVFASNRTYQVPGQGGSFEVEANTKLWSVGVDGDNLERRTQQLGLDLFPSLSPDGESIVYMSVRDDNLEIYLLRPSGQEINLTNDPARDTNPDWSPLGDKVAFMSDRSGNMEIYVMNLEDRSVTNISNNPAEDGDPAWSPDGSQIAFISDRDGNIDIYVMDADGGNVRRVTDDPADDLHPQWQP